MVIHRDSGLVLDTRNLGLLRDYSRNHHTLTNHGATPVRGKYGKGMRFDGVNDYISCGNDASLDITDAITIEVWAEIKILDDSYRGIVDVDPHYPIKQMTTNQIRLQMMTVSGGNQVLFTVPRINTWYEFALTYNKYDITNGLIGYVNGTKIGNANTYSGSLSSIGGKNWRISTPVASPTFPFNGTIASVKIYNRALSAYEISQHYHACGNPSKLSSAPKIL